MRATTRGHLSPASRFAVRFIETYQARVSGRLDVRCHFEPTCSEYGLACYRRYSFARATVRTLRRIGRCRRSSTAPRFDPP